MKRVSAAARGFSLVEMMVAMVIGLVLVMGAVFVYARSRSTYAVNETVSRLQEQGRYLAELIEPDVQLAGYLGYSNNSSDLRYEDAAGSGTPIMMMSQQRPAFAALPAIAHVCGPNFAVDLFVPLQGTNNAFMDTYPSAALQASCLAQGGGALANTDTLTIRRLSTFDVPVTANRLQVYISRMRRSGQRLFFNGVAPGPITANQTSVRDLLVRSFYVSRDSMGRAGFPALRVKRLNWTAPGGAPTPSSFDDEEIMAGVEDLQVQFGIDTGDYDNDGVIDPGADLNNDGIPETNGLATRYVNPDSPLLATSQIVAVRLWIRIRADQVEQGFIDPGPYNYADVVNWIPNAAERGFRRVLITKTIMLRNSRTL